VVADDIVVEHGAGGEHDWSELHISKWSDVTEPNPLLAAVRRYPTPGWLIDRLENEATPPTVLTVLVPDSVPEPGFAVDVMSIAMDAFAFVTVFPN